MSPLDRLEGRWECSNLARCAAVILYLSVLGDGRVLRLVNSRPHRPPRLRSSGLTKPLVNADVDKRSGHLRRCSFDAEVQGPNDVCILSARRRERRHRDAVRVLAWPAIRIREAIWVDDSSFWMEWGPPARKEHGWWC